jgi:hypothetical protein
MKTSPVGSKERQGQGQGQGQGQDHDHGYDQSPRSGTAPQSSPFPPSTPSLFPSSPRRHQNQDTARSSQGQGQGQGRAARSWLTLLSVELERALRDVGEGKSELDLWGAKLTDGELAMVLNELREKNNRTEIVDLSRNEAGGQAREALGALISNSTVVKHLTLSGMLAHRL